jgi:hypothetical protein
LFLNQSYIGGTFPAGTAELLRKVQELEDSYLADIQGFPKALANNLEKRGVPAKERTAVVQEIAGAFAAERKPTEIARLALPFPEEDIDLEESNVLLYTALTAKAAVAPGEICGMLVDEWTELIPAKEETTGIAFHYDRPNAEAPQTLLLVTPTALAGNWNWNDLVDALVYTLNGVRSRGIEPGQIDKTPFAALLPAVLGAESLLPYSIVLDNKIHYMAVDQVKNF